MKFFIVALADIVRADCTVAVDYIDFGRTVETDYIDFGRIVAADYIAELGHIVAIDYNSIENRIAHRLVEPPVDSFVA